MPPVGHLIKTVLFEDKWAGKGSNGYVRAMASQREPETVAAAGGGWDWAGSEGVFYGVHERKLGVAQRPLGRAGELEPIEHSGIDFFF